MECCNRIRLDVQGMFSTFRAGTKLPVSRWTSWRSDTRSRSAWSSVVMARRNGHSRWICTYLEPGCHLQVNHVQLWEGISFIPFFRDQKWSTSVFKVEGSDSELRHTHNWRIQAALRSSNPSISGISPVEFVKCQPPPEFGCQVLEASMIFGVQNPPWPVLKD